MIQTTDGTADFYLFTFVPTAGATSVNVTIMSTSDGGGADIPFTITFAACPTPPLIPPPPPITSGQVTVNCATGVASGTAQVSGATDIAGNPYDGELDLFEVSQGGGFVDYETATDGRANFSWTFTPPAGATSVNVIITTQLYKPVFIPFTINFAACSTSSPPPPPPPTCTPGGATGKFLGTAVDAHSVTVSGGTSGFACNTLITMTLTDGSWSAALTGTSGSTGFVSISGTATDKTHSLPTGKSAVSYTLTPAPASSPQTGSFSITIAAAPSSSPTATPTTTPTPSSSIPTEVSSAGGSSEPPGGSGTGNLASTGSRLAPLITLGSSLAIFGGMLLVVGARRRSGQRRAH